MGHRLIGRTLGGRYIVEGRVGGGGMATVYRGVDAFLRRQVALKILRAQFAGDAQFVVRFRREARAAAMLSHPNIVAVYDVGQEGDDCYYIVQEFIDGRTLKDRIQEEGPLPVGEALDITVQVLRALGQAHAAGVIHRDVKPQNVLLTRDGRVKVTDFGIARADAAVTMAHSGAIVGTAHYAAPEQVQGHATDLRCDIYSTGVMLFEALTGRVPYDGDGALAVALQHVQAPVPDPAGLRQDLPGGLAAVVARAMAKSPDDRYPSTVEFEADLLDVRAGRVPRYAGPDPVLVAAAAEEGADGGGAEEGARTSRSGRAGRAHGALRAAGVAVGIVVGLGVVLGGGAVLALHLLSVGVVDVPQLGGDTLVAAQQALRQDGLQYIVDQQYDATVPQNLVIRTVPGGGSAVRKNYPVQVYQSLGPPQVAVPALSGLTPQAAETELSGMGLKYQVAGAAEFSSSVLAGSVAASAPAEGAEVPAGTTVTLTLSAGPNTGGLPDYVGQPANTVRSDIAQGGWTVGQTTEQKSGWPAGVVTATDPAAGAAVLPGQAVNLSISSGCVYQQALHLTAGVVAGSATGGQAAPTPSVPSGSGGIAPGTPGFSETLPGGSSTAAPGGSSSGSSSSGSSSSASGPSASGSGSGTGAAVGMLETVMVSDLPESGPARQEFQQTVAQGQPFTVQLCWASPSGATYTWLENGVTRGVGSVGGTAGGSGTAAGSATGASGAQAGPAGSGTAAAGSGAAGAAATGTTASGTAAPAASG